MLPKTQYQQSQDMLFRPITLSLTNNQNKNKNKLKQLNHKKDNDNDQSQQDEYQYGGHSNNNLFNIYSEDSRRVGVESNNGDGDQQKGNGELIQELCSLISVNNVIGRMDKGLYQRIQRVLEAVQSPAYNKPNNNRLALKQLGSVHNFSKEQARTTPQLKNNVKIYSKTQETDISDKNGYNQFQNYQPSMKKTSSFCPANTYSITRQSNPQHENTRQKNTQNQSKQKKKSTHPENQPSLKQVKSTKLLTQSTSKKSRTPSKPTQHNHQDSSKQKVYKVVVGKKQVTSHQEQRSTDKKDLVMTRNPSGLSITAFTTRNKLNSKQKQKQKSKQKDKVRSNSKQSSYNNSKQSTGKLSKFNSSSSKMKVPRNDSLRRICTDQDYERMVFAQEDDDQKLFTNKQRIKTYQSDAYPPSEFIQNIALLQQGKNKQESQLEQTIKSLKQQIINQKLLLTNVEQSISTIKKQQQNFEINNSFLHNKKKEVHKKLQSVWNEVKILNASIVSVRENNEEILANVLEERQLVEMYNKVIEEIKQQLKIQTDQKDELKRLLKQSKKNEQASRIKAHTTKQKTEVILDNVRQSLHKWMI